MPLWKNTQHSFAAGQLDTHVMGRQDMDKYAHGATLLKNFLVKRQGCISKRRGTDLTADLDGLLGTTYDGTPITPGKMRLVPVTNGDDGRYLILSCGLAFVASRDGILTADRLHIRQIPPYVAEDADGNPVRIGGKDVRRSKTTPVDVIHRIGAGNYEVSRYATLQAAFDAAVGGDTIRLHNDYLLSDTAYLRSERFTPSDGVASTFAFDGTAWTMTRGGTSYTATANGRDIIDVLFNIESATATRTWTFSTSHANRTFTLKWNYPGWGLKAVDSAETSGTSDDLSVTFTIDGTDITATRASTSSSWSFSDGKTWTMAFSSGKWTASRTVGESYTSNKDVATSGFTVTVGGESVTASSSWSFSDGLTWAVSYINGNTFVFSNESFASASVAGSWNATSMTFNRRIRAERQAKQVTLDLYGYKLTVFGQSAKIFVRTPNAGIAFTSSRPGAKVWCVSNSNCSILRCETYSASTGDSTRIGAITFDGDIDWRMNGGTGNGMFHFADCRSVEFRSGTFTDTSTNASNYGQMFYFQRCTAVTVNGGKFDAGLSTGSLYIFNYVTSSIVVNQGEFALERTVNSMIFHNGTASGAKLTINGGKFTCPDGKLTDTSAYVRGAANFENYLEIKRGQFTVSSLLNSATATDADLIQFCSTGSVENSEYPKDGYYGIKVDGEADYIYTGAAVTPHPYRICVPYADADLADLCIRQSGDTLFIAHRKYPPAKIWFDAHGLAYFEEMAFDNSAVEPPTITSAVMEGQDPVETDWPSEFPRLKSDGSFDVSGCPSWLTSSSGGSMTRILTVDGEVKTGWSVTTDAYNIYWMLKDGDNNLVASVEKKWNSNNEVVYFSWMEASQNSRHQYVRTYHSAVYGWTYGGSSQMDRLKNFYLSCMLAGTVTDAGYNGNSTEGDDGSYSRACTYTCTSERKDYVTGRKTTTVSVLSFTGSCAIEKERTYQNGLVESETSNPVTSSGTAQNSASATSVIVKRTVRYVATYVKDGKESRPSAPVEIDYDMPWANNAVVNIDVAKGANDTEPEYYNIYKDNGNGYGLVGTTSADKTAGGIGGSANTYDLYFPDPTAAVTSFVCVADYEGKHGWSDGSVFKKLLSRSRDAFTTSTDDDVCLVVPHSKRGKGIVFDFESVGGVDFNRLEFMLDGRLYDKATDQCYLIYSQPKVTCEIEFYKKDGTTASFGTVTTYPDVESAVTGPYSGVSGTPKMMVGLDRVRHTLPSGDTLVVLHCGGGDGSDILNDMPRKVTIDLTSQIAFRNDYSKIKNVKLTFAPNVGYALFGDIYDPDGENCQGCIRSVHFYKNDATVGSGMFQDDYINPDMTVTPPSDASDPHFSAADDYPGTVGIYEQRLVFASSNGAASTIWMSRIADLYNFTAHESIREDDALELTLAATEFPNINHLVMGRDLMLFGDGGEWLISPVTGNALTYKTASAKLQSMVGSDRTLQPLQLADETLFAERGGTCLRSINYNYTSDSYQSNDLSVIAQSIFRANPIVSMAYKQHPDSIVECVLADGRVGTLVYMKEQEVAAWSVQELGGGWKAREIVTPKCIVDGTTEMMLLVEKAGVYQLWKVRNDNDAPVDEKQVILDGMHIETSSAPTGTEEVGVALGDGTYAIGWPVVSEFVSVRPEPEKGATAQMEIKNATESELRVIDASTFSVKPYAIETGWREVPLPVARNGSAVTLAEKDCKRLLTGTNNRDGRIHVRHAEPWPLTILSISNTYQIEYENEEGKGDGQ